MASLFGRTALTVVRQCSVLHSSYRLKGSMNDPLEHATGLEKREILAKMGGNVNPFDLRVIRRGEGSRQCPNEIPSAFEERMIGCICDEDSNNICWMWLHKGEPKRCECGHWFNLVHKAPV